MATRRYLALYTGPSGPTSAIFDADDDDHAMDVVTENEQAWYDGGRDDLGLDPDGDALVVDATSALAAGNWEPLGQEQANYRVYAKRGRVYCFDIVVVAHVDPSIAAAHPEGTLDDAQHLSRDLDTMIRLFYDSKRKQLLGTVYPNGDFSVRGCFSRR